MIVSILRTLCNRVVAPILSRGSRIWWCPTAKFTLLLLHAAGPYEKKKHNLSHFYHVSQDASVQHFVAVGQGMPNRKQPFESSFAMGDGPLTIRDVI
ncbi:uncharacterized protein EDB91DRAFT_1147057 [Suillus paluster]|uniref:uncharacterized protein n=1 Tax=Suillus paluster TaxID=48578 RepID=UPI001B85D595|nr:uncharacterized protein EDB91DRAFT_1147057 [Suillus paluster]KAG1734215.1 hypothetical protein EDB91DRAFT_1147057 [Suillus paluster]